MYWNPVWGTGYPSPRWDALPGGQVIPLQIRGEAYAFYIQAHTDRVYWQHLPG
jgi:hypothetical protein